LFTFMPDMEYNQIHKISDSKYYVVINSNNVSKIHYFDIELINGEYKISEMHESTSVN
jgi:hypothetical protein